MSNGASADALNQVLSEMGMDAVDPQTSAKFAEYLSLILRWNIRTNLTALKTEEEILRNHFAESIACVRAMPAGIESVLDFGSGAGFPGIPIAVCRPEVTVTLAESQGKKAAFLQEAVRTLGLTAKIHPGRAETLRDTFDVVTLRAVDKMAEAVAAATRLVRPGGWLLLMTTEKNRETFQASAGDGFKWYEPVPIRRSDQKLILIALKGPSLLVF